MDRQVASRYAEALLLAVSPRGEIDRAEADLKGAADLLAATPTLQRIFDHPEIGLEKKYTILERVFAGQVSEITYGFLKLLVRRDRSHLLALVAEEFSQLADRVRNIAHVSVTSAKPLDMQQRERLTQALARLCNMNIEMEMHLDPTVLAGVKVQIGDRMIDGSAAGRLEALRAKLQETGASL
jgi:F-type H+-transporting ATPase subunit delta